MVSSRHRNVKDDDVAHEAGVVPIEEEGKTGGRGQQGKTEAGRGPEGGEQKGGGEVNRALDFEV